MACLMFGKDRLFKLEKPHGRIYSLMKSDKLPPPKKIEKRKKYTILQACEKQTSLSFSVSFLLVCLTVCRVGSIVENK